MNAERLLDVYEQISEAPDAIARLRRFVLDLAVRGKLVEQDAGDEPASALISAIAEEKAILFKAGKIKKPKKPILVESSEMPFALPQSWEWVRLSDLVTKLTDGTHHSPPNGPTGEYLYISAKNIKDFGVQTSNATFVSASVHNEIYSRCDPEKGDILYIKDGATTGIATINDLDQPFSMLSSVALLKLPRSVFNALILAFLRSPFFWTQMREQMKGAAITRVTLKRMSPALLPLPPLAEQHRIVAKVDELMALCDRLEEARKTREELRDKLTAASLTRLTATDTTAQAEPAKGGTGFASGSASREDDFPTHAAFALEALPALTTRPDQIKTLRQTILNLAVRGKLVEQDPADEKSPRIEPRLADSIVRPFEIPNSWQWARLRSLGVMKGGGTPSKSRDDFWNGQIPWVSPKDMKVDYISNAQLSITDDAISGSSVNLLPPESILFVVRGMILAHSFPVAISRVPLTINQDMKAIVLNDPRQSEYVLRALWGMKPEMLERVQRSSHGTCRIEGRDYSDFLIPLPPLAEQHRIVAKVDALMARCDRLEAALTTTDTTRTRLLEALLHEALDPAAAAQEAAE